MTDLNPLRHLARHTPSPLSALVAMGANGLDDLTALVQGEVPGSNTNDWDPEYIEQTLPVLRSTVGAYHRAEVRGLDNIPDGPSLLVGNHSGGTYVVDTFVFALEFYTHFGPHRRFHQLAHDIAARLPFTGLRRYGVIAASHANARKAFDLGAPVLVYPGGDHETFRPTWHGAKIEFGGRKGFIRLALEEEVPIVPLVSIGGQETALFLTRGERAARALRLDRLARIKVLPVSIGPPFGINLLDLPGRIPLPAKITLAVMPPIDLRERFGDRPDQDRVYDEVTAEMQRALDALARERTLPFVG